MVVVAVGSTYENIEQIHIHAPARTGMTLSCICARSGYTVSFSLLAVALEALARCGPSF